MKPPHKTYYIGVDVGSTTIKFIVLDEQGGLLFKNYQRHKAAIHTLFAETLRCIREKFSGVDFSICVTGSAGMGIAEKAGIPFIQEVVASVAVVERNYPEVRTLIDLGGEDAKMVYLQPGRQPDIRMNGSCAGGTGAFIDQMADLMNISVEELGKEAEQSSHTYPIASRCGVFAKTDIQNLIARQVPVPDISGSIMHTVALQCITSLARGCEVYPRVICTGGPLTFLPALREAFRELLGLQSDDLILPENSEYFPAWGAALEAAHTPAIIHTEELISRLNSVRTHRDETQARLFSSTEDYEQWKKERNIKKLEQGSWQQEGEMTCFLGIDSGSTTTKIVVIDEKARLLYSFYDANEGNPMKKTVEGLAGFYQLAAEKGLSFRFAASAATGYGEELVRTALGLDFGIVETMAHLSGAQYIDPEVSFILDIGGQDMKSMFVSQGVISNIELNEACSSGCGSFLQNFAATMNLSLEEFSRQACEAEHPCDLGSRCTVFMNSKVKQSLREQATLGDIAAGLAYSVVKNCLFKVLKISNLNLLGNNIVVQGGTFRNDAVYRALELLSGKQVSSTDHPELMGALGAALYAQKRWLSGSIATGRFSGHDPLPQASQLQNKELTCQGCTNHCHVVQFRFPNGNSCYAGNKCEKIFFSKNSAAVKGYNAFDEKNSLLFDRECQPHNPLSPRLRIGIPRALNLFENYPFWNALFTACGFEVVLSPESTIGLYARGAGSVMADNICFPAKVAHGHIIHLIEQKVDRIFYPIVPTEEKEMKGTTNSFNCPVVSGYPDVIRSAIDPEGKWNIPLDTPVIPFNSDKALKKGCRNYFLSLGVAPSRFEKAYVRAVEARNQFVLTLHQQQSEQFNKACRNHEPAIVVAGRPYHADPLIHQKVGQILSDLGIHVFTDDLFRHHPSEDFRKLNMVSQWSYPNRVVQAALQVASLPRHVQLIQLNSFGCGPDSFFMDETGEILKKAGKSHTILRIDEIASPGSIRLRIRSLVESIKAAEDIPDSPDKNSYSGRRIPFAKKDRQKTILIPWFADFLSPFFPAIGELAGYKLVNLPRSDRQSAELGLKYGHNEVCYPSTLILGDIIKGLQSGNYDLDNIAVAITQTGGQCRATNYIAQIKSGLDNAGFTHIPVIAVSSGKVFQNEQQGFKPPVARLLSIAINTLLYGDALQQMFNAVSIREERKGETQQLFDFYLDRGNDAIRQNDAKLLLKFLEQAVADFNRIPVHDREYTRIGLIGEIYLKYNRYGQAHIAEWLREQKMEVISPPILDFFMTWFVNSRENQKSGARHYNPLLPWVTPIAWNYMQKKIQAFENIMASFRFYQPAESIFTQAEYASEILSLSNQFGEGWSIAAEVSHYARHGINRVVCVQPFGCIANHVVAKGIENRLKKFYPDMNLLYLDIDGGIAEVNLQNRLHFMIK